MVQNKWTKPNRTTEVLKHEIRSESVNSPLCPSRERLASFGSEFSDLEDGETVWFLWTWTRTGLDKEAVGSWPFRTREQAEAAKREWPVGTVYGYGFGWPDRFKNLIEAKSEKYDPTTALEAWFLAFDEDSVHSKCYEALAGAGVISEDTYETTPVVLDWLGEEHIEWIMHLFGESWSTVGQLEYCINHFADSSLASLAAKLFFAQFIANDDFAAGYITKEIEVIVGGTEQAAQKSTETRRKAGLAGGEASRARRKANLDMLMEEIESLGEVTCSPKLPSF